MRQVWGALDVTIQDLGSIGELIAAVATVATLAYLAVQLRANTQEMKVESIRAQTGGGMDAVLSLANNAEIADIYHRGLVDLGSLSPVESDRFTMIVTLLVNGVSGTYLSNKLVPDSLFMARGAEGLRFLRAPGGRTWWAKNKRVIDSDFAAWVETELDLGAESAAQSTAP
jgi:hypothetical protein